MAKFTILVEGERVPVRPIGKFTHRGESFFIHSHQYDRDKAGITHTESGLSAGTIDRHAGYRAIGMKRVAFTRQELLDAAVARLARIPEENFQQAMRRARGES